MHAVRLSPLRLGLWLALSVWTAWLFLPGADTAITALLDQWRVSLTMVFGALIAGGTSQGGGAVAFPVFTKVLGVSPEEARVFALAIQAVGMTAASVVIVSLRLRVDWKAIRWAAAGGVLGVAVGFLWLAPLLGGKEIRVIFTALQIAFGITLYTLYRRTTTRAPFAASEHAHFILLASGVVGGIATGLCGNGIDIVTFSVLVAYFGVCERVATPTSVILMAANAIVGFGFASASGAFTPTVQTYWLAAVPVVVVCAPLGATLFKYLSRRAIVWILLTLASVEAITTFLLVPLTASSLAVLSAALVIFGALYGVMALRQLTPCGAHT